MAAAVLGVILLILYLHISHKIDILSNELNYYQKDSEKQLKALTKRVKELENNSQGNTQTPKEEIKEPHIIKAEEPHIINEVKHTQPEPAPQKSVQPATNFVPVEQNKPKEIDIENLFIGNIFSKIGGIALVIAICFFVKLASNYIEFTPELNITLGYLFSLGILSYSFKMYRNDIKITSEILAGVSIAGLLLSTYFGCYFYQLFPVPAALIISFIIAIISFIISKNYNSFSTIAIGLFGGYLNPAVFSNNISITALFAYLIALNLISVAYTYRNGSKNIINCVNIFMTIGTLAIFSNNGNVSVIYPLILWALYIFYDIITSIKEIQQDNSQLLRWFNFGALIYITNHIFKYTELMPIGLTILGTGLIYSVLYYVFQKKNENIALTSLQSALFCLCFTTYYIVRDPYMGLAWAIEGYLTSEIYLKLKNSMLQKYVLLFFVPAILYLLINYQSMFSAETTFDPIIILLIFLGTAGAMIYSAHRLKEHDNYLSTNLNMLGFSVLYIYAAFYFNSKETFKHSKLFIDTIIAAIYSLHSYKLLSNDFKEFSQYFSYLFYGLSALLLFIAECLTYNQLDFTPFFNIKFAAYLSLIALSIYYGKYKNDIFNYVAVVLGMFSLVAQINCIFQNILPDETIPLILTTILIVYSGIILTIGILKDIVSMKHTSICLILILLSKLILIDLYNIEPIYKLLAFVVTGFILLGVSSYYQKKK